MQAGDGGAGGLCGGSSTERALHLASSFNLTVSFLASSLTQRRLNLGSITANSKASLLSSVDENPALMDSKISFTSNKIQTFFKLLLDVYSLYYVEMFKY